MRVWDGVAEKSVRYAKDYGWTCFGDAEMVAALRVFVVDAAGHVRTTVVQAFLERLRAIRAFVMQGQWTLYASSVLFVYEGDTAADSQQSPTACMIDFAHSWPVCFTFPPFCPVFFFLCSPLFLLSNAAQTHTQHEGDKIGKPDTKYLVGLDNVARFFEMLLRDDIVHC